jgi:methionine aminopeptidase
MRIWREGKLLITIKTPEEIAIMREGGLILGKILYECARMITPGITTAGINTTAEELLKKYNVKGSFKGYLPRYASASMMKSSTEFPEAAPLKKEIL